LGEAGFLKRTVAAPSVKLHVSTLAFGDRRITYRGHLFLLDDFLQMFDSVMPDIF